MKIENIDIQTTIEKAQAVIPHLRNLKHFHGIQIIDTTTFIEKVKCR